MKKFLVSALAAFVILASGSAFAQALGEVDSTSHDVEINIPYFAFLRFTSTSTGLDAVDSPTAVVFDLNIDDIQAAAAIAPIDPTSANWDDLQVFVNYGDSWSVTASVADTSTGADFDDWSKVSVGAWNIDGGSVGTGTDVGWTSLGFGPQDFLLTLDGGEIAGEYSATVTYTLTLF